MAETPQNITIDNQRQWRMALQIEDASLRVVMWSTVEDSSLLHFALPLNPTLPLHKAIEEAVYATPVLLSDFLKVDVIVRTQSYMPLPSPVEADIARDIASYSCLSVDDSDNVMIDTCETIDYVWAVSHNLSTFLARTFRNPELHSHMWPLTKYFARKNMQGNGAKIYAHFSANGDKREMDILCFDASAHIVSAVTHSISKDDDAVYYILATAENVGLDGRRDQILLCGNMEMRDSIMPQLRRFAPNVMPAIFPSAAFRLGREALYAPFPLIIMPLCE